jgi:POT family proton-dependent oligopeptide transporter
MSSTLSINGGRAALGAQEKTFLGHPMGLFLLFLVEMWERFSYYGMRGILVLYLTSPTTGMLVPPPGAPDGFNPGRGWSDHAASTAYGWYTGLCYLAPIIGGMIADKLIGTHRSMVVGGLLIALGHVFLGVSGIGPMEHSQFGMAVFVFGLALIILGTGHFKPCVSVMVGQLYAQHDPRRETAFGIFYMGINLGAAVQTYIVGTLGERLGWHWGFGAAAVGMLAGLVLYLALRPRLLSGVGVPPEGRGGSAPLFVPLWIAVALVAAWMFHGGQLSQIDRFFSQAWVVGVMAVLAAVWAIWFVAIQERQDRGPVTSIMIFMLFNAMFWLAFEQAGSSINLFTDRDTDRTLIIPTWLERLGTDASFPVHWAVWIGSGAALIIVAFTGLLRGVRSRRTGVQLLGLLGTLAGIGALVTGILKPMGYLGWVATFTLIPTTWFQSINPWLIIIFAPVFGAVWTFLSRRGANPSMPTKIGVGLVLVGLGYLFLVYGALQVKDGAKAAMFFVAATYFVHTVGEIILSPTGLSYVTKAAPPRYVSLLMGVWFISSFIANLLAGKVAAQVEKITTGEITLPWRLAGGAADAPNTQADFFFLFVVTSCAAGVLILAFVPLLKKLIQGRE